VTCADSVTAATGEVGSGACATCCEECTVAAGRGSFVISFGIDCGNEASAVDEIPPAARGDCAPAWSAERNITKAPIPAPTSTRDRYEQTDNAARRTARIRVAGPICALRAGELDAFVFANVLKVELPSQFFFQKHQSRRRQPEKEA